MARSADKLLDTLNRELPRTLESLRKTGGELTGLTDELEDSIKGAKNIIKHTETSIQETQKQIKQVHHNSRSTWAGLKTAWKVLRHPRRKSKRNKRRR